MALGESQARIPGLSDAPPELDIGRALAIARLGCLPERIGLGLELLIGTVQRRRAVTGAYRWRFRNYAEVNSEVAWCRRRTFGNPAQNAGADRISCPASDSPPPHKSVSTALRTSRLTGLAIPSGKDESFRATACGGRLVQRLPWRDARRIVLATRRASCLCDLRQA